MNIYTWYLLITAVITILVLIHNASIKGTLNYESIRNADQIEKQRDNPIKILYLRNFLNDTLVAYSKQYGRWEVHFEDLNFETKISKSLNKIGHFIAIGRQGEDSYIGAERKYFTDSEWKAEVLILMRDASMIIIRPFFTVGLVWEFEQLTKYNYLSKTIICTEREEYSDYEDFRKMSPFFYKMELPKARFWSKYLCLDNKTNECHFYSDLDEVPLYVKLKKLSIQNNTYLDDTIFTDDITKSISDKAAMYIVIALVSLLVFIICYLNYSKS